MITAIKVLESYITKLNRFIIGMESQREELMKEVEELTADIEKYKIEIIEINEAIEKLKVSP